MSETKVVHKESWTLTITPEEDDIDWPPEHKGHYSSDPVIRPDTIIVHFEAGDGRYSGSISGFKINRVSGRVSEKLRGSDRFYGGSPLEWAAKIIQSEIAGAGLTTKLLGE
ncbi:MAG TPA: hypothetical protein VGI66_03410 [Streptosporangiaceae bacterium]